MKRSLRIILALAALVSITFTSAGAFAYNYLYTCGPSWGSLPVSYYINENGSADVPFSTVEQVIQDSFDVWGDPCCSKFGAEYEGTTQLHAYDNQNRVVLSWTEDGWNQQWGSVEQTIGLTFSQVYNTCEIADAPILFNGVGFEFSTNGRGTDLQSIATHEIGHLLGLGHSSVYQATMYASYVGGTGARSLHQDDVDGVCSLYNRSCSCNDDDDCSDGDMCENQQCVPEPCTSDDMCESGMECDTSTGECVIPPCDNADDCAPGFVCEGDVCVSSCPVCRRNCESNADCGSNGVCAQDPEGGTMCIIFCGENAVCPGDSACYRVPDGQGGNAYVCGAPDAENQLCPQDYTCQTNEAIDECEDDSDCDADQSCDDSVDGKKCKTDPTTDPCDGVTCDGDKVCQDGECVDGTGTGNNTTGNNGSGSGGTTEGGGGEDDDSSSGTSSDRNTIIIISEEDETGQKRACTAAPSGEAPGAPLILLGLFFAARLRRRR